MDGASLTSSVSGLKVRPSIAIFLPFRNPSFEESAYAPISQLYLDYSKLKDIAYASMAGPLSSSQLKDVDQIGLRLDQTKYQSASEQAVNLLVASKSVLYQIKKYARS